jgi:hypothetical protein
VSSVVALVDRTIEGDAREPKSNVEATAVGSVLRTVMLAGERALAVIVHFAVATELITLNTNQGPWTSGQVAETEMFRGPA